MSLDCEKGQIHGERANPEYSTVTKPDIDFFFFVVRLQHLRTLSEVHGTLSHAARAQEPASSNLDLDAENNPQTLSEPRLSPHTI